MTITSKYRLRYLAVYLLAVLNVLTLLGLTLASASDETVEVCSTVNNREDCGFVLPDDSKEEISDTEVDSKEVKEEPEEKPVTEEVEAEAETPSVEQAEVQIVAPVVQPEPTSEYVYPGAQGYSAKPMAGEYNGSGSYSATDDATASYLSQLGYSAETLWQAGIKIVGYQGLVEKNCAAGSTITISGMAVKPVTYMKCPNGEEVIPDSYKTDGKCTVHYDASKNYGSTTYGSSKAVLAHELSHCLHFIYGEYRQFDIDYKQLRGLDGSSQTQLREVMADDFMICRHGLDTSWGAYSYYNQYGVNYPSVNLCADLNDLFNRTFPV